MLSLSIEKKVQISRLFPTLAYQGAAKKFNEEEWVAMTADRSENTAAMAEDNDGTMNEEETE